MDQATMSQAIASMISGLLGAGFASWVIKMAIGRSFSKIDQLETGVAQINTTMAAISVKIGDLIDLRSDLRALEKVAIESQHRLREMEERVNKIERSLDRILTSKCPTQ